MSYKKCGFRDKAGVCNFKEEDCTNKECDFFDIDYSVKGIKKQIKIERKNVIKIHGETKEMKKAKTNKSEPEKYKELKKTLKDKAIGVMKLSKSYAKIKRMKIK